MTEREQALQDRALDGIIRQMTGKIVSDMLEENRGSQGKQPLAPAEVDALEKYPAWLRRINERAQAEAAQRRAGQ